MGRENFPKTFKTVENQITYKPAEPQVLKDATIIGKNVLLLTTGSLVGEALLACDKLKAKNIGSLVVNQNCLNKIDLTVLKALLQKCEGRMVTAEDHQVLLGFGAFVTHQLAQAGVVLKVKSLGVKGEFGQSAYNAIELYRKHGIDSDSIVTAAEGL